MKTRQTSKQKTLQTLSAFPLDILQLEELKKLKAGNCCGSDGDLNPPPTTQTTMATKAFGG